MKLSIIIPCYNVEKFVVKTIDSLRHLHDAEDVEFVFVNDGSTDNTLSILKAFAESDSRAVVIDQTNQGVSAARNAALAVVRGERLLCLDGDDYLEENAIDTILNNMQEADLLLSPVVEERQGLSRLSAINISAGLYTMAQLYESCYCFPLAPMLVYRTALIREHQLHFNSEIRSGEVYEFTVSVMNYAKDVRVIDQPFYHYVLRSGSATHYPNVEADLSVLRLLNSFESVTHSWAQSDAFRLTTWKILNAFTYNKYIHLCLTDTHIMAAIDALMENEKFRQLLSQVAKNQRLHLKDKVLVHYQRCMPHRLGFRLLVQINRFNLVL